MIVVTVRSATQLYPDDARVRRVGGDAYALSPSILAAYDRAEAVTYLEMDNRRVARLTIELVEYAREFPLAIDSDRIDRMAAVLNKQRAYVAPR